MCSSTMFFMFSFSTKYLSMYSETSCSENPVISTLRWKRNSRQSSSDSSGLEVTNTVDWPRICPLISLAHNAATGISSLQEFGYLSCVLPTIQSCREYSSKPSIIIKSSSGWLTKYCRSKSSIRHWSFNSVERFKTSCKETVCSPSKLNCRKVNKKANAKSGNSLFLGGLNNLSLAQSRSSFWQKRLFPIPAFPVRRMRLGLLSSSAVRKKISWLSSTWVPLTRL